jgi:hypothetical protein
MALFREQLERGAASACGFRDRKVLQALWLFAFEEIVENALEQLLSELGHLMIHWITGAVTKCIDPCL